MKNQDASYEIRRISTALCEPIETARPLDENNVAHLQQSILTRGLLQPILVVAHAGGYRVVAGNHRLEAMQRIGLDEIDAIVLADASDDELLMHSLHENHVRRAETLPDIMRRVTALAHYQKCSFAEAAASAGISESAFSKIQTTLKKLGPEAMALVAKHRLGMSICYEVARRAANEKQQVEWLTAHIQGELTREQILESPVTGQSHRPKRVRVDVSVNGVEVKLAIPATMEYGDLMDVLATVKSRLALHAKQQHPIDLLPRLMSKTHVPSPSV